MKDTLKQLAFRILASEDVDVIKGLKQLGFVRSGNDGPYHIDYYKPSADIRRKGWDGFLQIDYSFPANPRDPTYMYVSGNLVGPSGKQIKISFKETTNKALLEKLRKSLSSIK